MKPPTASTTDGAVCDSSPAAAVNERIIVGEEEGRQYQSQAIPTLPSSASSRLRVVNDPNDGVQTHTSTLADSKPTIPMSEQLHPSKTAVSTSPSMLVQRPYSSFSKSQKWMIVVISSLAGIFSPISSSIFVPALPVLVQEFQRSTEELNLTMTLYLIFQAITPSFWGSLSDSIGRRPIYIITLIIYIGACIGLALTPTSTYWLLIVLRCLQAAGASSVIAIGAGCVSDISTPEERGTFLGVFSGLSMLGPALGPTLGGILVYALSWRWIFWILAIACGAVTVVLFLLVLVVVVIVSPFSHHVLLTDYFSFFSLPLTACHQLLPRDSTLRRR